MILKSIATLTFVAALATAAFAQTDVVCDEAALLKAEQQIGQINDGAKKIESAKELDMAKQAMAANDVEKCKSHLSNAIKGMDAM
ncbi:hypothetical protein LAC81_36940 (plasmid) [Ensifer adhaerens]|uniref:hypothetical protein n=1 Tax=Ensifer adhaerens TaxID=106592 RepID=UPI001CBEC5F0|nr:hypothetical protein [Ensifer adhaerens]MBZ7927527.1 hypothetical protein [Ensifer adhaerens]UAX97945.1 hypothetical protein LAC78_38245 [Ensifer adhaerens]UAY05324.1 hypothetical protein LAC80_36955 [Ensifer adhaerens]UAY12702.1 hypothetical protein LAC81_36940 [Ensifer adhaerens]